MPDNNHEDLGFDAFLEETRAMTPLPASEIRRLGDRRRTRPPMQTPSAPGRGADTGRDGASGSTWLSAAPSDPSIAR